MSRTGYLRLLIFIAAALVSAKAWCSAEFLAPFERARLPEVRPPHVQEVTLGNGMKVLLLEDHTIPVVKVSAVARAGSIYDPPDKVGLASVAVSLMRSGGAGERTPGEFDAAIDGLGASLSPMVSRELAGFSLDVLSGDGREGMALLFDVLARPAFDGGRLKVVRSNLEEALRRDDDDPESLAQYKFRQLVYGEKSPWARRPTRGSLRSIGDADVRGFHSNFFRAGNIIIAAAGDFDSKEFIALIEKLAKPIAPGEAALPPVEPVALTFAPADEKIEKATSQSYIRMGHLSVKRDDPDKFALFVVDEILGGGGFKSRLMEDIRVRRGLAYSIWSSISPDLDYGTFTVGVDTRVRQADEAIGLVRKHIERLTNGFDVTQAELDFAKRTILSRLIFQYDSPFKAVSQRLRFRFYGYPDDYWRIYRDRIAAIRLDDVSGAASRHLHPEDLKVVVVGPAPRGGGERGR
jgi:zinc protease